MPGYGSSDEICDLREELANLNAEMSAILTVTIPSEYRVHVRECGGPESVAASLAVSVGKMRDAVDQERAKRQLVFEAWTGDRAERDAMQAALRPFAEAFERAKAEYIKPEYQEIGTFAGTTVGDFRRAWEALGGTLDQGLTGEIQQQKGGGQ